MDKGNTTRQRKTPIDVLYQSLSTEDVKPKKRKADWIPGSCSVCGQDREVISAGSLMGMTFGSWQEMMRHNGVSALCKPCAWAFKDKRLLRNCVWIEDESVELIDWHSLGERLLTRDVSSSVSVIAPNGGRKIVAPYATYGYITADGGVFKWTSQYKKALGVCKELNKIGIRGSLLTGDRVPTQQVLSVSPQKQKVVHDMWKYLAFVRDDKTLLGFFVKLSMNMSSKESVE